VDRKAGWGAVAGIASAAVALGVAEVVAVATGPRSTPIVAVGGVVVDNVPEPVKQFAIDVFGVHDKTALLIGTGILLAVFAGLIGVLAVRDIRLGYAGIGVFALIGIAAALTRPGAGPGAALPAVVGAAAGALALWALLAGPFRLGASESVKPAERAGDAAADPRPGSDNRRRFLATSGGLIAAAAVAGGFGRVLSSGRDVSRAREALTLPNPTDPAPPVPAAADLHMPGLTPYLTPNADFYRIDTALVVPRVDPRTWQLRIHGRVGNPMTLTYDDLLRRPLVERHVTLACVSNEVGGDLIGNARWLGVHLKDLLDEAAPDDGADQVVGRSADGWTCGSPTEILRDGRDALLAIGMNGEPLPIEHGFPARVVVPGLYGYVSACKWVVELELSSFADFDAYWVPRGWAAQAPIKTQSRIDTPRSGRDSKAGTVTVAGVAWAQHRGIARVEVRVDDGPWQEATLASTVSRDTWRQWSWRWEATSGEHTLSVRATDATGQVQPGRRQPVAPDGAPGWHTVRVTVV
jgi:DMSO/TMAO reductase YedYZ molybdopterin-dependent catalytic subunit